MLSRALVTCCVLSISLAHTKNNTEFLYEDYSYDYDTHPKSNIAFAKYMPVESLDVVRLQNFGDVKGSMGYKVINNRAIHAFFGLKYGTISSGLGRFQKASTPYRTNRIFDARIPTAGCPSFPDIEKVYEAERHGIDVDDCLTLTIFTPSTIAEFPVMVYVHGEMLFDGNAEEAQPDYLLENDIVLVSVNYRLAPFGFVSALSSEIPGNVALADLQMALEFIQENIRSFGGNPDQVTLFGQSGGAAMIHALGLSSKANGLFNKIILQSGTALNPYFIDENPLSSIRQLARTAKCPLRGTSSQSVISCFAEMKTSDMLRAFQTYWKEYELTGLNSCGGFRLAIGDQLGYVPKHPASAATNFEYPLMAGIAKDAGAFIMSRFYKQLLQIHSGNISDYINIVLLHTSQPRHFIKWNQLAMEHIFTMHDSQNVTLFEIAQGLLELSNLILYRTPLIESIRITSKTFPTFLYSFDHRGEYHRFGHLDNPLPFPIDSTLSDENIYLFPYPEDVKNLNKIDRNVARQLTTMWSNFAYFGMPLNDTQVWPKVSSEYGPYVRISQKIELDYHFGEGIPVPNLYTEFKANVSMTTIATPTQHDRKEQRRPHASYFGHHQNYRRSDTL